MPDPVATPGAGTVLAPVDGAPVPVAHRAEWRRLARETLRKRRTQIGLVATGVVLVIAIFGPLMTSTSPTALVGAPYGAPGKGLPFGADYLGRDVWSRFLHGGLRLLLVSLLATVIGVVAGAVLGLIAGYSRKKTDETIMRALDIILSFPAIILALLFVTAVGNKWWLVAVTIGASHAPRVARVTRGATVALIEQDYVHYAEAIGVPRRQILFSDLLPNVTAPLTVEFGLRVSYSVAIVAALAYLGSQDLVGVERCDRAELVPEAADLTEVATVFAGIGHDCRHRSQVCAPKQRPRELDAHLAGAPDDAPERWPE